MRDLHQALKVDIVQKARAVQTGTDFLLVRHQWGKAEIALSLHAAPNQFTTSGMQTPDFLAMLRFERSGCPFSGRGECFARWVSDPFELEAFSQAFDQAYQALRQANSDLEACGFFFEQMEGWGYFFGKRSRTRQRPVAYELGDGHTAAESKVLKRSDDAVFQYLFTWNVTGRGHRGWVTHYRPKNPPLSADLQAAFAFLGSHNFAECPHFDFEPCSWTGRLYEERGEGMFDNNTDSAHQCFDAHAQRFSPGIHNLLTAHGLMERFDMKLLPFEDAPIRLEQDFRLRTLTPPKTLAQGPRPAVSAHNFDVAISFAGTERKYAEELANRLREAGFIVFYDNFYPESLWGKDLVVTFHEIYSKRSRFCVIFVSKEYNESPWTVHERRSAQERMLQERGGEYILPIKVNDVDLPGLPGTVGYVSLKKLGIDSIAEMLVKKLKA
jgi:hypothetical protein